MPFDCNCHGINFQKEFADATQTKQRIEAALKKTFDDIEQEPPLDKDDLRATLLANGGALYEAFYENLLDSKPGCMRACTNTLMYILSHTGEDVNESQFKELRGKTIPDDIENAASERRNIQRHQRLKP